MTNTDQPQPTAALSDAELIADNQAIREAMTRMLGIDRRRGLTIVEMPSVLRELLAEYGLEIRRLARADAATGVNIDRGALYRLWKHAQGQRIPPDELERSAALALAVLADAGTDSGTGAK